MENLQHYVNTAVELAMTYGPKLLLAIITYIVVSWLIKKMIKVLEVSMEKSNVDVSLRGFLSNFISVLLKLLLIISVVTMLGVETTSLIAILGAAGLAIGLALQGSLANFAGGILILFFKPFQVGDYVQTSTHEGSVEEIQIFVTILRTLDNKRIIIPNSILSNESLQNVYANGTIRLSHHFGIGYEDSIDQAKEAVLRVVERTPAILKDPSPKIQVFEHGNSSIGLELWSWVKPEDHWEVHYSLWEEVKKEFDISDISIPFPQRDIHLYQEG